MSEENSLFAPGELEDLQKKQKELEAQTKLQKEEEERKRKEASPSPAPNPSQAQQRLRLLKLSTAATIAAGLAEKNINNQQIAVQAINLADLLVNYYLFDRKIEMAVVGHGATIGGTQTGRTQVV